MPSGAVPYETLVEVGVVQQRLSRVWSELAKLDEDLGRWITEQLGSPGRWGSDEHFDHVCDEFLAAVERRAEDED